MAVQRYLLLFFTFCSCYHYSLCSSWQEGPPVSDFPGGGHARDKLAYPTFFGTILEDAQELQKELAASMGIGAEVLELEGLARAHAPSPAAKAISVDDHGAKGDGSSDDTKAFLTAWEEACSSSSPAALVVPAKKYLLKPITFSGPCKSGITVRISGTVQASSNVHDWDGVNPRHWILFQAVSNLRVEGGGTIDGSGKVWWQNSCKVDKSKPCKDAPTAVTFYSCNNLVVNSLRIQNSQQIHVSFEKCRTVQASNLMVSAPGSSPNTDGIHVTGTQDINIINCVIGTGDDCISIVSGSANVKATGITCGPGHGISIGGLGKGGSKDQVSKVVVDGAKIVGATNGVRIKTWQGGSGSASNIVFQNIAMTNVGNPIIIDQNYCDSRQPCPEKGSAVAVSGVVYKSIQGTSATESAIKFACSKSVPCRGILLQDINLKQTGGKAAKMECNNVVGQAKGTVLPPPCF